ncbi:E3 ubiquitin-protein ligase TRIM35-like [Cheilinus undulatus]|uniref:E3 ubiquitin-protein ligase TRIM35-like n=1 Tax=Cheilinus undulatus TaxID=241271 RepID=UPI001BD5E1D8|nr:E3 ubiquitin-protein ligase TRIM35-like [Cheilinus undulatus]
MAGKMDLFKHFLNCRLCLETFTDPVSLTCNHSFCSSCLQNFWKQAGDQKCPVCQRRSSKGYPGVNFPLKELADFFAASQAKSSCEPQKKKKKEEIVCDQHPEVSYWFCEDENRTVCPICEFSFHQTHKVTPVEQATHDLKEQLKSDLKCLREKSTKYKQVEETYNKVLEHSKKQLLATESQIKAEFIKLHQFLKEEEESRLVAVREEEEQKRKIISKDIKKIQQQISSLSQSISAVEEELKKHNVSFLSSYKATQTTAREKCSMSDPKLVPGALIDVAKHVGNLSVKVWEKVKDKLHFSPVILDPNTVNPCLHLSDDLTILKPGNTQQPPNNPERFSTYSVALGSEGFSSGRHSWEVEVGDNDVWFLGLAQESVDRRGEISATPEYGIWCLKHHTGKYTNGLNHIVTEKKNLQKIRVKLDYEKGEVSFYDPEDNSHIYTHKATFTGKVFPYFGIAKPGDAKTTDVKICTSSYYNFLKSQTTVKFAD